jgi:hypothetical protein
LVLVASDTPRRRPKRERILPFRAGHALGLVAERAGGLFAWTPELLGAGLSITIERAIGAYPSEGDWRLLGDWIANVQRKGRREPVDPGLLAKNLGSWLPAARAWASEIGLEDSALGT